ncbi:hypothetical protein FF2_034526 [Malus domestica]
MAAPSMTPGSADSALLLLPTRNALGRPLYIIAQQLHCLLPPTVTAPPSLRCCRWRSRERESQQTPL